VSDYEIVMLQNEDVQQRLLILAFVGFMIGSALTMIALHVLC
jgi:hypothetical protein